MKVRTQIDESAIHDSDVVTEEQSSDGSASGHHSNKEIGLST